ncbi:sensor domain-containing protein [Mycobacteroides salmoniphilum]|nr:sensor domain-containing protein [Mycobacteroides salmoniphilum]
MTLTMVLYLGGCGPVSPETNAEPQKDISADSLVLTGDDVGNIASFQGFMPEHTTKSDQPRLIDPGAPKDCGAVYDQNVAFGTAFKEFLSVTYGGLTDEYVKRVVSVTQNIGAYPDAATAYRVFDQLVLGLTKCSSLQVENYKVGVTRPDPSTIFVVTNGGKSEYRVKSSVLMYAGVGGLSNSGQVAHTVLDTIADRVQ